MMSDTNLKTKSSNTSKSNSLFKGLFNWTSLAIVSAVIILVNVIASYVDYRFDVTQDKRYSLSEGTKNFLSDEKLFSDRLIIKIYLDGKLPAELMRFRNDIENKLKEFKQFAGKRIEYQFIDPLQGNEADQKYLFEQLYNNGKGILPMDMLFTKDGSQSQMIVFPGATIDYAGSTVANIQFLPGTTRGNFYMLNEQFNSMVQNSINNLEYMLISAIRRATQMKKPNLAFLHGHGELEVKETLRARALINNYYNVGDVMIEDSINALDGLDGLIIARPRTKLSDKDLYVIDQFVLRGGKLMVFMDKLYVPADSLMVNGVSHSIRYNLGLDNMLFDYGIKVNDNFVLDVKCAPKAIPTANKAMIPWFYSPLASTTQHPISRNLEPVHLEYASEIQFVNQSDNVAQPILTSSTNSVATGLAPMVSLGLPIQYGKSPQLVPNTADEANKKCLAGIVEGGFISHFKTRIVDEFAKNPESKYLESSKVESKVLVVGNGTFIRNDYDSTVDMLGKDVYQVSAFNNLKFDYTMASMGLQPIVYGNQEFFQNLVDYVMGDNSVIDIRSRQIDIHAIDKEKVKEDAGFYKFINMVLPSLLIILLAVLIFYIRKKKYTRH